MDSKGFRILKDQVNDLSNLTTYEIANHLKSRILYNKSKWPRLLLLFLSISNYPIFHRLKSDIHPDITFSQKIIFIKVFF